MALDAGLARTDQGSAAENEGPEVASGAVPDVMTMTNGMRIAANIGTQTAAENVITTATGIDTMAGIVMAAMKNTTVTVTATIERK